MARRSVPKDVDTNGNIMKILLYTVMSYVFIVITYSFFIIKNFYKGFDDPVFTFWIMAIIYSFFQLIPSYIFCNLCLIYVLKSKINWKNQAFLLVLIFIAWIGIVPFKIDVAWYFYLSTFITIGLYLTIGFKFKNKNSTFLGF